MEQPEALQRQVRDDFGLVPVRVETWGVLLFACLDPETPPLTEWLGDLPDRLKRYPLKDLGLGARKQYTLQANWKIVAENFTENYHLQLVHPKLAQFSRLENKSRVQGPGI